MVPPRTRGFALCLLVAGLIALSFSASARADTVTDWNTHAVNALVGTAAQSPTVSTIHLAMVHGAVYDAVTSIDGRYEPYLVRVRSRDWYSQDAAAATAAYRVLLALVPAQQPTLAPLYEAALAAIPAGDAKQGGIRTGEIAAAAMLADRNGDGRGGAYRFPAPTAPRAGRMATGPAGLRQRPRRLGQGRSPVPDPRPRALRGSRPVPP